MGGGGDSKYIISGPVGGAVNTLLVDQGGGVVNTLLVDLWGGGGGSKYIISHIVNPSKGKLESLLKDMQ